MSMSALENEGARAVFQGKRYVLIPNYQFHINLKFRSLEREIRLSANGEESEVDGVAAFGRRRITMMGMRYRKAPVLVIFSTFDEYERKLEGWGDAEELAGRWPCWLDYEVNEQTGILRAWRLVLDMPPTTITRIAEIATLPTTQQLGLTIHLRGLYMPEKRVFKNGRPQGDLSYLLPRHLSGQKIPRSYGYASQFVAEREDIMKIMSFSSRIERMTTEIITLLYLFILIGGSFVIKYSFEEFHYTMKTINYAEIAWPVFLWIIFYSIFYYKH